jgi:D-xylose transport system substrate-binding protein
MKFIFAGLVVLVVVTGALMYKFLGSGIVEKQPATAVVKKQVVIGLSMASNSSSIDRWIKDRDFFVSKAEELGAKVTVLDAGTDAALQQSQAENMILQGVNVLVVVPEDGEKASVIVDEAHKAGIKVIAYDRLIKNPSLDYYVSFDNVKVGQSEAQGVLNVVNKGNFAYVGGSETDTNAFLVKQGTFNLLQPLIDKGDVKLVYNEFTKDWRKDVAYTNMKKFLDGGGMVDAVIAANDSTAAGVIQALEEKGLAGKVPVSGQDASLAAVQYVANGEQTVTIYKPIKDLANKAAEMAVALTKGESISTNNTIQNGSVLTPAYLLDVVSVTKDTIDSTVIKDGFLKREDVYGK